MRKGGKVLVKKLKIVLLVIALSGNLMSQVELADSLKNKLKTAVSDTVRCKLLSMLVQAASEEEWESFNDELLKLSEKNLSNLGENKELSVIYKKYLAAAYNNKAFAIQDKGEILKAKHFFEKALAIRREINDQPGIAQTMNNLGTIFQTQGNVTKAIEYYQLSLSAREKSGDLSGIALGLNNLANIFLSLGDIENALKYYTKSLELSKESNTPSLIANSLNGLGATYRNKRNYNEALNYYKQAYECYKKMENKYGMAIALNNIGVVLDNKKDFEGALNYYKQSLALREAAQDKTGIAICMVNMGRANGKMKRFKEGMQQLERAMEIGKAHHHLESIKSSAQELYLLCKDKKEYKRALQNLEIYIQLRDSVNNENTRKAGIKNQLKYEYEKQAAADSVAHAKESEIKNAELAKQKAEISVKKNQQYALFGGLGLVMIFAGFMYNRFKVTQKQKRIIEEQKNIVEEQKQLVEEKQKEILDSIHYAKRIQMAQVPSEKRVWGMLNKLKKS